MKTLNADKLHDAVEFDCPFRVLENGSVERAEGFYAPDLLDEQLDGPWEFVTGYSGQYLYSGPIMHNSEYLGGKMAEDVLARPGVYCLVAAYWTPEESGDPSEEIFEIEGWALVRHLA